MLQITLSKYLGSIIRNDHEKREMFVNFRFQVGCVTLKGAFGVISDRKVPLMLKRNFYHPAIRYAMLFKIEYYAIIKSRPEYKLNVVET